MKIIPVLDLLDGQIVHAKKGERRYYRPINSILCHSAEPDIVLTSLLSVYPFKTIYIADLNAIQALGNNETYLIDLAANYPDCKFWLDVGITALTTCSPYLNKHNILPVIGSEKAMHKSTMISIRKQLPAAILSLDFNGNDFTVNHYLLESSRLWPQKVIVMMLSRVGTGQGVDRKTLKLVKDLSKGHEIYAAGGIANADDLLLLEKQGVSGALISTSLHNGTINTAAIERFMPA